MVPPLSWEIRVTQASLSSPLMSIPQVPHEEWWHERRNIRVGSCPPWIISSASRTLMSESMVRVKVSKREGVLVSGRWRRIFSRIFFM